MRLEEVLPYAGPPRTLNEKWNTGPREQHWYAASTQFAKEYLGEGHGRTCLVIGSPIYEATELIGQDWDVTYMDIRNPPVHFDKFIHGDATDIKLPDSSFDAVSTSCVLTHAGTGRYGDGTNREHGDEAMLGHIARVMKPSAIAAITFGALADIPKMVRLGAAHRIYTIDECRRMLDAAALKIVEMKIWSKATKHWLRDGAPVSKDIDQPDYISFSVTK
jgi:hypothetical protein